MIPRKYKVTKYAHLSTAELLTTAEDLCGSSSFSNLIKTKAAFDIRLWRPDSDSVLFLLSSLQNVHWILTEINAARMSLWSARYAPRGRTYRTGRKKPPPTPWPVKRSAALYPREILVRAKIMHWPSIERVYQRTGIVSKDAKSGVKEILRWYASLKKIEAPGYRDFIEVRDYFWRLKNTERMALLDRCLFHSTANLAPKVTRFTHRINEDFVPSYLPACKAVVEAAALLTNVNLRSFVPAIAERFDPVNLPASVLNAIPKHSHWQIAVTIASTRNDGTFDAELAKRVGHIIQAYLGATVAAQWGNKHRTKIAKSYKDLIFLHFSRRL